MTGKLPVIAPIMNRVFCAVSANLRKAVFSIPEPDRSEFIQPEFSAEDQSIIRDIREVIHD